jgi:hypothetical protein
MRLPGDDKAATAFFTATLGPVSRQHNNSEQNELRVRMKSPPINRLSRGLFCVGQRRASSSK